MGPILRNAARIAGQQHGVITTAQLIDAGLARSSVKKWHQKGLLHREFRGLWRFGHRAPSYEARYMAAVLACGDGAGLSGAAALFHLPLPKTNRRKGAHYVDCRWPGLTVELDSYRFHHSRHSWEQDR